MNYAEKLRDLREGTNIKKAFERLKPYLEERAKFTNSFKFYNYDNESEELDKIYAQIKKQKKYFKELLNKEGLVVIYSKDNSSWEEEWVYIEW